MKRAHVPGWLLLGVMLAAAGARAAPSVGEWEPVVDGDGVRVERRAVEGSKLKEFRGRGVVEAPLSVVLAVINDVARRTEWMPKCVESRLIEQLDALNEIAYNRTQAPWPVSDRDVVLHGALRFDAAAGLVEIDLWNVSDERAPKRAGVERMPYLRGHWILRPVHGGAWTDVEYQVQAKPGGGLTDWVANQVSKQLPRGTIRGLRAQVKKAGPNDERVRSIEARADYQTVMAGRGVSPPGSSR